MHGPSQDRVSFDDATSAMLETFADTLIPGDAAFPPPSAIRIVEDFMRRYVAPDDAAPLYLPGVTLADVGALAAAVGDGFAGASGEERAAAVAALEAEQPELFARLQTLVYAGYYSRPEVRAAIASTLEAGRDLRRAPQPYGYADVIEPWDEALLSDVGAYVRTDDVRPIDRDVLERLVAAQAADQNGSVA